MSNAFSVLENGIVRRTPTAIPLVGAADPLDGQDVGGESAPALGDLDADGDLDLVVGEVVSGLFYYENTRGPIAPGFVLRTGSANPVSGVGAFFVPTPVFGDLDADGDLDLVLGDYYGGLFIAANTGSATSPGFGTATIVGGYGVGVPSRSSPTLGDLDADGDLDLLSGDAVGAFAYFENTGTSLAAAFAPRTGAANPLDGFSAGAGGASAPELFDVDRDGDLDLVAGNGAGGFAYFENTGTATTPLFAQRTGSSNPLDGELVPIGKAEPALGNLISGLPPTVVSGDFDGSFTTYPLPEPSRAWLLTAGAALLAALGRRRKA